MIERCFDPRNVRKSPLKAVISQFQEGRDRCFRGEIEIVPESGGDHMAIGITHASRLPGVIHCEHDVATAHEILYEGDVF